uniref:Uncharacterized protein n=1 Tax=Lepeophtheirus salmonis TaxID=72036 RepID=A0A0K2T2Z2_LEPSM
MSNIDLVISVENVGGVKENSDIIASFNSAPMTSVDCERSLCIFKTFSPIRGTG